jgi:hypothetical protein
VRRREIGRKLVEVKERVEHGKYTAFVTKRLGWSMDSALRFARVYELTKSRNLRDFDGLTIRRLLALSARRAVDAG